MRRLLKCLLALFIAFSVIVSAVAITAGIYLSRFSQQAIAPELLEISNSTSETVFYRYDFINRQDRVIATNPIEDAIIDSGFRYRFVPISSIPSDLINAFVAIEDKRFFKHNGVDLLRSTHAVINYVFKGNRSFGGSTITQQLIKNLTGRDEISAKRKISEAFAAIDLEKEYSKTEILEKYLNVINLANNCRGVGAAAEYYYSKQVSELTVSECATIAAITNNPSKYDPVKHPENNKARRDTVLKCMLDEKYISQSIFDEAVNSPIALNISKKAGTGVTNSWYIDMVTEDVITDLCKKYGITHSAASLMLYGGGYKVYTAMDGDIQRILENYYADLKNFPADAEGNMPQSSMIVIDPYTGDVLGVAGGIGKKSGNRIQSYATDSKRPPGSVIKPLSVYAHAIDMRIVQWSTIVSDTPVTELNGRSWPANASNRYDGDVNISYAIKHSLNTIPVKLLHEIGNEVSFDFLKNKLLINSLDEKNDMTEASLALGQPSRGITLREATAAYTIFTDGIMCRPRSYFKVTDRDGKVILDNLGKNERVISQECAAIMTKLMQEVVRDGSARGLISLSDGVEVAGKTGTTQNTCDRYFIGYTPQLLAGVWFGYEYPKSLSDFGGNYAAVFWNEVMSKIYDEVDFSQTRFRIPDGVTKQPYNKITGERASVFDSMDIIEEGWFFSSGKHNNEQ